MSVDMSIIQLPLNICEIHYPLDLFYYFICLLEPKSVWFYILILMSKSRVKSLVTCYKDIRTHGVGR